MRGSMISLLVAPVAAAALSSFVGSGTVQSLGAVPAGVPLVIQLQLDARESLEGAAVGYWLGGDRPALVYGTVLPGDRGRLRVLHWQDARYRVAWTFTFDRGTFDNALVKDVNKNGRPDVITLWTGGQGAYLDVLIFEWDDLAYREIWNLGKSAGREQLTQGAEFSLRRIDDAGGVELVIRAPIVSPGDSTLGRLTHQVSIYRWDSKRRTFVLFRRFVDQRRTYY